MDDERVILCAVSRHPEVGRLTMGSTGKEAILIDVWSDVVCPWCYIGEKRLAMALADRPDLEAEVRWRPFQLQPGMPEGGVP
jgi:predicted DsbA family dithiol-disulfide isomerase